MFLDHQSIMSGRKTGPLSMLLRPALRLASLPYGWAVSIRNRRYDRGASEVHDCGVPVISVGNLTTGGTGKTPVVCLLATWFRRRGIRVAIVSRGYGRGQEDCNDEAMELHARLPDVPHVQDPDRVSAAMIAVEELQSQVILMDDGFQHRRLHRDLDIVVVDSSCPFGYGYLLPRGLLREPLSGLGRAALVILTRCESVDSTRLADIESTIRRFNPSAPLLRSDHRPTQLLEFPENTTPIESLAGQQVAVLSAIGNPIAFEETIRVCGAKIVDTRRLPDHDAYSPTTVQELNQWIRSLGDRVTRVVCTHKDLVKLQTDRIGDRPLAAVLIELAVTRGRSDLDAALEPIASRMPGNDS